MRWIIASFMVAAGLYLVVAAFMFFGQRRLIYFPPATYHAPPAEMTEVSVGEGVGWYAPARGNRPTVMVFHGNASSIDSNLHIFRDLMAAGYGVWSVGYPGYPGNAGTPTQASLTKAALTQYDYLVAKGADRIVLYGTSLGSAVAAQVAARRDIELLVMDAPFNSMSDMARRTTPWLPTGLLLRDDWRSDEALAEVNVPLIWIHGAPDRVVPLTQGRKLYEGYAGPKTERVILDATHTNTWLRGGREIVLERLQAL